MINLICQKHGCIACTVQKDVSPLSGFYKDNIQEYLLAGFLASLQLALQHAEP